MRRALACLLGAVLVAVCPRPSGAAEASKAQEFVERPLLKRGGEFGPSEAARAIEKARRPATGLFDRVNILADKIDHLKGRDYVIATGSVDITYQSTNLKADRVEFNTKTGDVVATGDVILSSEGSLILCQKAVFNIYTKRGFMYDAEGFASPVYYFTGKKIEKVGDDKLSISEGTLTTCGPTCGTGRSPWTFRVQKANLQLDRYAHIFGFVPMAFDVPLFFLPYYVTSIKRDRGTGFLSPVVGHDSEDGLIVTNRFYWAINPSMDATFGTDYLSNRGTRYNAEFRYVLDLRSTGQFNASYLKDGEFFNQSVSKATWLFDDDRGTDDLPLGGEFYKITLDHKQVLPGEVEMVGRMDLESDDTNFDREFSDDLDLRTRREMDSFVSVTKNWETRSVQIVAERIESLEDNLFTSEAQRRVFGDEEEVFGRLPSVQFLQQSEQIDSTPFYFEMASSWTGFFEKREEERLVGDSLLRFEDKEYTPRFDIFPKVSLPITFAPWLSVTPAVGFRETYWWRRRESPLFPGNVGDGLSREAFEAEATLRGPTVYRIFHLENRWAEKYKHLVEPKVSYRYISDFDEADSLHVPVTIKGKSFDGIDTFDRSGLTKTVGVSELTYGFTNRVLSKSAEGKVDEIFRLEVSQLFDIKEHRKDENRNVFSLGPIEFDLESRLIPPLLFNTRARYDYAHERVSSVNSTIGLEVGNYGLLYTDYNFSQRPKTGENRESFVVGAVGVNLTDAIHAQYRIRYDENEGRALENQYILVYRGCCWSVEATLFDRVDETRMLVMLDLKGIGSVGHKFRVGTDVGGKRRGTRERLPDTIRQSLNSNLSSSF
ncbi:MAG: LPS-assembly protein LptD [Nitrospinota bacterium]